ncbi:MAG TPA: hypothetical protein VH539_15100 [Gemmatimonadaceae bacterium]|jgi:hypothetical protein
MTSANLDAPERVPAVARLLSQALLLYAKACGIARKHELAIGNRTAETDAKIVFAERLIAHLGEQHDLGLDGTPLGDALAEALAELQRAADADDDDDEDEDA